MAKSDIEIAREATTKPITEIAQKLDIAPESFKPFGHDKAKLTTEFINSLKGRPGWQADPGHRDFADPGWRRQDHHLGWLARRSVSYW